MLAPAVGVGDGVVETVEHLSIATEVPWAGEFDAFVGKTVVAALMDEGSCLAAEPTRGEFLACMLGLAATAGDAREMFC